MGVKRVTATTDLADDANNELVNTKHTKIGCKQIYLGHTQSKPYLKKGTVFNTPEAIPEVSESVKKCIVSIDKMVEFEKRLNDKESLESLYYNRTLEGAK